MKINTSKYLQVILLTAALSLVGSAMAFASAYTFTVHGNLFYDDSRGQDGNTSRYGNFSWHKNISGSSGARDEYLGAAYAVIDVWDYDNSTNYDWITSITVQWDGSFSKTITYEDSDGSTPHYPEIAITVRLRNNNRFRMETEDGDGYWLWWWKYNYEEPYWKAGTSGRTDIDLGTAYYSTSGNPAHGEAALGFASFAEVFHYTNVEYGIDLGHQAVCNYPSSSGSSYSSGGEIYLSQDRALLGRTMFHEYGHLIHYEAWNGTTGVSGAPSGTGQYCYNESGSDCSHYFNSKEYRGAAFKEGWAEFVELAALQKAGTTENHDWYTDDVENWDAPSSFTSYGSGDLIEGNIATALCDWIDVPAIDDHASAPGNGDHFYASFYSAYYNLLHMVDAGDPTSNVFAMDEYVDYYVNTRKPDNLELIRNLVYNNWMSTGLSSP